MHIRPSALIQLLKVTHKRGISKPLQHRLFLKAVLVTYDTLDILFSILDIEMCHQIGSKESYNCINKPWRANIQADIWSDVHSVWVVIVYRWLPHNISLYTCGF